MTVEYIYDANGNLEKDYNKRIVDIQYNSLFPDLRFDTIKYCSFY